MKLEELNQYANGTNDCLVKYQSVYKYWTGIGAIGSFIVGILILHEPMGAMRMMAAILIVSGLVLMKLSSPT